MLNPAIPALFPASEDEATQAQFDLAPQVIREDRLPPVIHLIAGVDVAYDAATNHMNSAVVVVDAEGLAEVETAVAEGVARFPYQPGLFSFRELPAIMPCLERIQCVPDLIICDGQGIAHPRRFGLASHLGVLYDVPTIGCAKTPLMRGFTDVGPERGDASPIIDRGEIVGAALRTQRGVKPIYVSQGHRISLATACRWILHLSPRYRLPEPLRAADQLANAARAGWRRRIVNAPP